MRENTDGTAVIPIREIPMFMEPELFEYLMGKDPTERVCIIYSFGIQHLNYRGKSESD